ncbi:MULTISPECIES: TetR/AcrR family transcriptional regulator [unclassified Pseudonocardia]|uniref:TetR/AcrR family transcriptional regulator n=1 Tax=unclassified Pseudonocardia TaxID=2619320 RepID=UPI0001FFEDFD|nr:TetR/AcrR family transcriptional regulator [Pseudonocardia sp. Ae707_Ps1]OLM20343.1 Transcriptional regulator, TetR family [Pseudonocardia sp. Ae707_Ps1]
MTLTTGRAAAPPRELLLDAFEHVLLDGGPRCATTAAVAHRAGMSKGGLLHHFPSHATLVHALCRRLEDRVALDLSLMRAAPAGRVRHYLGTCLAEASPLNRTFVAVTRLRDAADPEAGSVHRAALQAWRTALREESRSRADADVVLLVGHGARHGALPPHETGTGTGPASALAEAVDALLLGGPCEHRPGAR